MPILDLQTRSRELGRIRTGEKTANGAPKKLTKFRITAKSKTLLEKVAQLYGGEVREWTPAGGVQQWEVYTHVDRIPIMVPPQPVTQWYEKWTAGGCVHRCDGQTDYITGEACDPETSPEHEGRYAAKPTTRLNVILSEVEGIGYFRLESHGWNAAVELPQAAEFLAYAGGYVEGFLALEERVTKKMKDGQSETNRFLVPIIEIAVTPAQLMAGQGRVQPPALNPGAAGALPAGQTPALAPGGDAVAVPNYLEQAQRANTLAEVQTVWHRARDAGHMTDELNAQLNVLGDSFTAATPPPAQEPDADGAVLAEVVDEGAAAAADIAWQKVLRIAGQAGLTLEQTSDEFSAWTQGMLPADATAEDFDKFADYLANGHDVQVPA